VALCPMPPLWDMTQGSSAMLQSCRAWFGCFLLAAAQLSMAGESEKSVETWLEQMVHSVRTLSYEGTFVYLHNTQLETMQITHTANDNQEQERIFSLNGAAREVIRTPDSIICILPDAKTVSVMKPEVGDRDFPAVLPMNLDHLSNYYEFRMLGGARIADREAVVIGVIPRDAYRYGYRLFLDADHALPLKTDAINEEGEVVSQIMFTSLRVDPSIPSISSAMEDKSDYSWVHSKPAQNIPVTLPANWQFKALPDGFQLQARTKQALSSGTQEVEHFVFSDGLATFSVYIEKAGVGDGLHEASRMGAINAYGTEVAGHQITAVGEVPAQTVRTVANAAKYSMITASQ